MGDMTIKHSELSQEFLYNANQVIEQKDVFVSNNINRNMDISSEKTSISADLLCPPDKHSVIRLIIILEGIFVLLSWTSITCTFDFFNIQYTKNKENNEYYGTKPEFAYPFWFFTPSLIVQILMILYGTKINPKPLLFITGIGTLVSETLLFLIPVIWEGVVSFYISCLLVGLIGLFSSAYDTALFGLCTLFGLKYTNALMGGSGLSGIISCILRSICLAIFADTNSGIHKGTWVFVGFTLFILSVATYALIPMYKNEFVLYHLNKSTTIEKSINLKQISHEMEKGESFSKKLFRVYSIIWLQAVGTFLVFCFTYLVYPGIVLTHSSALSFTNYSWSLILYNSFFNISDTTGRFTPIKIKLFKPNSLIILTLIRGLLLIIFLLIALNLVILFDHDAFKIVNICIFAFTNGYAGTLHMMYGPHLCANKDKPFAGYIMNCFLYFGMFFGSLLANFAIETAI